MVSRLKLCNAGQQKQAKAESLYPLRMAAKKPPRLFLNFDMSTDLPKISEILL
jgi:hypothetical protein